MKILIVTETTAGNHDKVVGRTDDALKKTGFETTVVGQGTLNPQKWHEMLEYAQQNGFEHVHIAKLLNPYTLLQGLKRYECTGGLKISFTLMGLGENLRRIKRKLALQALSEHDCIDKIVLMSIHPNGVRYFCQKNRLLSKKTHFMNEPPFETVEMYRNISKSDARKALNFDEKQQNKKVALYCGSYWFAKGADFLLQAAKNIPSVEFYFVGDLEVGSLVINPQKFKKYENIHFINRFVPDEEMRWWFRAADLLVMPYRIYYEHGSSSVFNQAMLAETPVCVPDFRPFDDLWNEFPIGVRFQREDWESLQKCIETYFSMKVNWLFNGFDQYLAQIKGWTELGTILANGGTKWKKVTLSGREQSV